MSGRRATITVGDKTTTKTYHHPPDALAEIRWYQTVPWAAPKLLDADLDRGRLVIASHLIATSLPDYRPADALAELLQALAVEDIHHRDVHVGNVVAGPDGPLLIDWETAAHAAAPSYDLYGPDISGVPVPDIHAVLPSGYCMWWGRDHRMAIGRAWGAPQLERQAI